MSGKEREPDVEIGAAVSAKKLRFKKKPKAEVRIHGDPGVDGESGSSRENLPDEVEAGKTYRDVRVVWRATGRLKPEELEGPEQPD
jgi:hypothetical protein